MQPVPAGTAAHHEQVVRGQGLEHRAGGRVAAQGDRERGADLVGDARGQQELLAPVVEGAHLVHEVGGDPRVAPVERERRLGGIVGGRQRHVGEPEAGGPALGGGHQVGQRGLGQVEPVVEHQASLVGRERQVGGADVAQPPRDPQPVQRQRGVVARDQHEVQAGRRVPGDRLEQADRAAALDFVDVVEDQHDPLLAEQRQEEAHPLGVVALVGGQALRQAGPQHRGRRLGDRRAQAALVGVRVGQGRPDDRSRGRTPPRPVRDGHALACSGAAGDERDGVRDRLIEEVEDPWTGHERHDRDGHREPGPGQRGGTLIQRHRHLP